MTLEELRVALAKATAPSYHLDIEIEVATTPGAKRRERWAECPLERDGVLYSPPNYTASIDAAMTLVPEGFAWHLWSPDNKLPAAELKSPQGHVFYGLTARDGLPALALCIARVEYELQKQDAAEAA